MLSYIAFLKFLAKPADALDAYFAPIIPAQSPQNASTAIAAPTLQICPISPVSTPLSIMDAIRNGIMVSNKTSKIIKIGVNTESFLNSFICAAKVLIIFSSPFLFNC